MQFGFPPTLPTRLCRRERIPQQFECLIRIAELRPSICEECEHVRPRDAATGRKQRETLFHQSDSLLKFAGLRCRPSQEEPGDAAHHWKLVFQRYIEELSRKFAAALRLATDLKDNGTVPHRQGEAIRMRQAPSQRDSL